MIILAITDMYNRPYDVRLWQAQGMCYEEIRRYGGYSTGFGYTFDVVTRYREAIECLKRALIPADPHEITIFLKLARLHQLLEESAESVAYHRRVVEVCQADRKLFILDADVKADAVHSPSYPRLRQVMCGCCGIPATSPQRRYTVG